MPVEPLFRVEGVLRLGALPIVEGLEEGGRGLSHCNFRTRLFGYVRSDPEHHHQRGHQTDPCFHVGSPCVKPPV